MNNKKALFYSIAICLPFAILFLIEVLLRAGGYGASYPLFVPAPQFAGYLQPNPDLIKRYFGPNSKPPNVAPDTFIFNQDKPANTYRIVTMGGSTMAGFPYGRFASPAGMLKQRFKASNPSKEIEIISVAMSSVNTYTLLDITQEVIAIKPDAVLIYAGHNEYLGVMGVGSVYASKGGHGVNLLYLKLKEVRLFQMLQSILSSIRGESVQGIQEQQRTVMAQVAKNKAIVFEDEIYNAGVSQFSSNLDLILAAFKQAKIPVLISNLVANEKDQAPFESVSSPYLDELTNKLSQPSQAISAEHIKAANQAFHANYFFALAKRFEQAKDLENAHGYFIKAMDFDLLRFRAPSIFNTIIADKAQQHNAMLVDTHQFMHVTGTKIIGYDLMLEHLHPNHRGYFFLAEAFYQSMQTAGMLPAEYPISSAEAWQMSPITQVDEILADYKIAKLTSDYPFTTDKKQVSKPIAADGISTIGLARINGTSWVDTQRSLLDYYQQAKDYERAANAAATMFDAIPGQTSAARAASILYLRANILPMAKYYALKAVELDANKHNYRLTLAEIYYKLGNTELAIDELDKLLSIAPNNQRAKQIKAQISQTK
jgi:tetratricopeptide (TPR) repeat protein